MMGIKEKAPEICPTTTQKWVASGALLVDVREKKEVEELAFNVPNIVNIPLSIFEEHYTELPQERDLVIVCRSGIRSLKATYYLMNNGYDKVVNMKHGIIRWVQKGFPTRGYTQDILDNSGGGCSNSGCC